MDIDKVFVSINARDFTGLSQWYCKLLGRHWDREPMPSCHEWDIAGCVFFQVLDKPESAGSATATFHLVELKQQVKRLNQAGISVPEPQRIKGFNNLFYCEFTDPEGNVVGLVEGS